MVQELTRKTIVKRKIYIEGFQKKSIDLIHQNISPNSSNTNLSIIKLKDVKIQPKMLQASLFIRTVLL